MQFLATAFLLAAPAAGQGLVQVSTLDAGANPDGNFGAAAALSGETLIVGAPDAPGVLERVGAAHIFERHQAGGWSEVQRIEASLQGAEDHFGTAVALDGTRALLGAPGYDGPATSSGAAFVFERDAGGTWIEVARLEPGDAVQYGYFGESVALDGDRALVGAPFHFPVPGDRGAAYVFERQGDGSWTEVTQLRKTSPWVSSFAKSVALDGDRVAIGDPAGSTGRLHVFERSPAGAWTEAAVLLSSAPFQPLSLGGSVALDGDRVLGGSFASAWIVGGTGSAYLFERGPGGTWAQEAELPTPSPPPFSSVVAIVALEGDRAFVANPYELPLGGLTVFERNGPNDWPLVQHMVPPLASGALGGCIAVDGGRVASGTLRPSNNVILPGQAYVYAPALESGVAAISLSAGGVQPFAISAGPAHSGELYLLLGSLTGTSPGLDFGLGLVMPLAVDSYLLYTLANPNQPPLGGSLGQLDADGHGFAALLIPPGSNPALAGLSAWHAFVAIDLITIAPTVVSNATAVAFTP